MKKSLAANKTFDSQKSRSQKTNRLLWLFICSAVVVATAVLFFTLQKIEQKESLAAEEAQAAKAKIIAPCEADAQAYGVKAKDVAETFTEDIRTQGKWQLFGTDSSNTRTNNGDLVFEVNNKKKGFNNAYVSYVPDFVGDLAFQTVVDQLRYDGVRKGTGDAYGQLHVQVFSPARRQLAESVLRVREVKSDAKKWEVEMLYRDNTKADAPWESLAKREFNRENPLKLRFVRKGDTLHGLVKNADQESSFVSLATKTVARDGYMRAMLALDSIRNDADPEQRLRIRYRNFRAFCPPEAPEADLFGVEKD